MTDLLLGKPVAETVNARARASLEAGIGAGRRPPSLVSVHRAEPSPFTTYLERQRRAAQKLGVSFRDLVLPEGPGAPSLRETLLTLERSDTVDAVLVEHPLPERFDFLDALSALRPEKDVDGVGPANLGRLLAQRPTHGPAVALAALSILEHYRVDVAGRRVTVIGRSPTVGLPLAVMLASKTARGNASVTVAHSRSDDLGAVVAGSEVILSCAGRPGLLTRRIVPEGAVVIDIGLTMVPKAEGDATATLRGDADPAEMEGWAKAYTPVPGGVGPVTVAELMSSVVRAWEMRSGGDFR